MWQTGALQERLCKLGVQHNLQTNRLVTLEKLPSKNKRKQFDFWLQPRHRRSRGRSGSGRSGSSSVAQMAAAAMAAGKKTLEMLDVSDVVKLFEPCRQILVHFGPLLDVFQSIEAQHVTFLSACNLAHGLDAIKVVDPKNIARWNT